MATLNLYEKEGLFFAAAEMGKVLGDAFHSTSSRPAERHRHSQPRARRAWTRQATGTPGKRAYYIFIDCFKKGALVRSAADTVVIAPPYVVEKSHIDTPGIRAGRFDQGERRASPMSFPREAGTQGLRNCVPARSFHVWARLRGGDDHFSAICAIFASPSSCALPR